MKTREELEQEIYIAAVEKYVDLFEQSEIETGPWERFKHSKELNDDFFGDYNLYCEWLNVGKYTEFDREAEAEWMRWAEKHFQGLKKDAKLILDLYANPPEGFQNCKTFHDFVKAFCDAKQKGIFDSKLDELEKSDMNP